MNTVTIDTKMYQGVERYAKRHNLSINDVVKYALTLLLRDNNNPLKITETEEYKKAMTYMDTLVAKEGHPVPANENGIISLIEKKYSE